MIIYNAPIKVGPILDPITDIVFPDGFIKGFANYTEYQDNNSQVHNVPQFQVNSNDMLLYGNDSILLQAINGYVSVVSFYAININTIGEEENINIFTDDINSNINLTSTSNINLLTSAVDREIVINSQGEEAKIRIKADNAFGQVYVSGNGEEGRVYIQSDGTDGGVVITSNGQGGSIQLQSITGIYINTNYGIINKNWTTAEINILTGVPTGSIVYNTTLGTLCFYDGAGWRKVSNTGM